MEVFFCHVLRILTSEFDKSQEQTGLRIKVLRCASGMSVVIMSAEPSGRLGFVNDRFLNISCLEAVRQGRNDISEANLVCWRTMLK